MASLIVSCIALQFIVCLANFSFVTYQILQYRSLFNFLQGTLIILYLVVDILLLTTDSFASTLIQLIIQNLYTAMYFSLSVYRFSIFSQFLWIPKKLFPTLNAVVWVLGVVGVLGTVFDYNHQFVYFAVFVTVITSIDAIFNVVALRTLLRIKSHLLHCVELQTTESQQKILQSVKIAVAMILGQFALIPIGLVIASTFTGFEFAVVVGLFLAIYYSLSLVYFYHIVAITKTNLHADDKVMDSALTPGAPSSLSTQSKLHAEENYPRTSELKLDAASKGSTEKAHISNARQTDLDVIASAVKVIIQIDHQYPMETSNGLPGSSSYHSRKLSDKDLDLTKTHTSNDSYNVNEYIRPDEIEAYDYVPEFAKTDTCLTDADLLPAQQVHNQ